VKAPFSSRHAKIALAFLSFKPAMRLKERQHSAACLSYNKIPFLSLIRVDIWRFFI